MCLLCGRINFITHCPRQVTHPFVVQDPAPSLDVAELGYENRAFSEYLVTVMLALL